MTRLTLLTLCLASCGGAIDGSGTPDPPPQAQAASPRPPDPDDRAVTTAALTAVYERCPEVTDQRPAEVWVRPVRRPSFHEELVEGAWVLLKPRNTGYAWTAYRERGFWTVTCERVPSVAPWTRLYPTFWVLAAPLPGVN